MPDDHPAVHQFVAEVRYLDERREDRRRRGPRDGRDRIEMRRGSGGWSGH